MTFDPLHVVLAALAVYRLSYMAALEEGPFRIFWAWRELWIRRAPNSWITRGFQCILCISFWLGFVGAAALAMASPVADFIMAALALSAVTVILKKFLSAYSRD